ncbi:MAG: succinate dehydrogenase cytochrome b subunit [bacterium]
MSIKKYINSSIGKKQIVATSGLMVVGFIFFHMVMNLLFLVGPAAYNLLPSTAHKTGIVFRSVEAVLAGVFLIHIIFTALVTIENRKARGSQGYASFKGKQKRSLATRLMPVTGSILLLFIITHLIDFWWPDHFGPATVVAGVEQGTYGLVFNSFKNGFRVSWYVIALLAIGMHLAHGVQSMFQSFGFRHQSYTPKIERLSTAIGLGISLGFSLIPIYVYFIG